MVKCVRYHMSSNNYLERPLKNRYTTPNPYPTGRTNCVNPIVNRNKIYNSPNRCRHFHTYVKPSISSRLTIVAQIIQLDHLTLPKELYLRIEQEQAQVSIKSK